jgi:hypothetical protein
MQRSACIHTQLNSLKNLKNSKQKNMSGANFRILVNNTQLYDQLDFTQTQLQQLITHHVGNKLRDEKYLLDK